MGACTVVVAVRVALLVTLGHVGLVGLVTGSPIGVSAAGADRSVPVAGWASYVRARRRASACVVGTLITPGTPAGRK